MRSEVAVLKAPAAYTLAQLAELARGPLEEAGAERAVAFGSHARGKADAWSDLDLAVVLPTSLPFSERWTLLRNLLEALPLTVDLLVYTPEEFERGLDERMGVFDAIAREGVEIYARCARLKRRAGSPQLEKTSTMRGTPPP
jgi:predicted nucleotidyltransferase